MNNNYNINENYAIKQINAKTQIPQYFNIVKNEISMLAIC